jgi:hypothetical protein
MRTRAVRPKYRLHFTVLYKNFELTYNFGYESEKKIFIKSSELCLMPDDFTCQAGIHFRG